MNLSAVEEMVRRSTHRGQLIGMRLRASRERSGLSPEQVATHFDVKCQTVLNWEMGRSVPSTDRLSELADLYHIPLSSLIGNYRAGTNSFDHRYIVIRADGENDDPETEYFILRLGTDPFARKAIEVYAANVKRSNPRLSTEIYQWLDSSSQD